MAAKDRFYCILLTLKSLKNCMYYHPTYHDGQGDKGDKCRAMISGYSETPHTNTPHSTMLSAQPGLVQTQFEFILVKN